MIASGPAARATDADLATILAEGAGQLELDLDGARIDRLVAYLRLIERWNATYNLTAVRDVRTMATQHVVDCLAAIATLRTLLRSDKRPRILDVGSGAGLPGVVVAIVDAAVDVVCVDSVGKKAAFITQVAASLALENLNVMHARVESIASSPAYEIVVSRAYASLADLVRSTRHLLAPDGWWLAMKAKISAEELSGPAEQGVSFDAFEVQVPGLEAERRILVARNPSHRGTHP